MFLRGKLKKGVKMDFFKEIKKCKTIDDIDKLAKKYNLKVKVKIWKKKIKH